MTPDMAGVCRVYRGGVAASQDPGFFFIAQGGPASVADINAHGMGSIWERPQDQPAKTQEPAMA
jgi:hypothetical protein